MKLATFTSGSGDAAVGAVLVDESAVIGLAHAHERLHGFLSSGDVVELEIEGIGTLRNRFVQ